MSQHKNPTESAGKTAAAETTAAKPLNWAHLIRNVLRQLETPHKGITLTRKKDGLEVVLNRFAAKPEVLFDKLNGLQQSWGAAGAGGNELVAALPDVAPVVPAKNPAPASDSAAILQQLRELLAQSLENP